MKNRGFAAAMRAAIFMFVAVAAFSMAATRRAAAVDCSGPLKQCAIEVGAFCEMENGKMMIWYKEREGAAMRFEECVGKVYEAHGRPNPYRPAPSSAKPAAQR
jgi:hypothetical protein